MKLSVIFPMAGLGSRFGYTFKPFLKATEDTFIEWAKKPFDGLKKDYSIDYYFIIRSSQEKEYNVTETLHQIFPNDSIHCLMIQDTDGPFQTLQEAIRHYNLTGSAFVCDCDHSIDITPMVSHLFKYDVLIPTWAIQKEDYPHWGKIQLSDDETILDFCEKEFMDGRVKGLIGCYYFKDLQALLTYPPLENISSILKLMFQEGKTLKTMDIQHASFFGTPNALEQFRFQRAQTYTMFMDIDGTLIHQTDQTLLPGTLEQLHIWKKQGHRIILTTAKEEKHLNTLKTLLESYKIPYDQLLSNLSPGPRYIINDRKPYLPFYCMAQGIVLDRNEGIQSIQLPSVVTIEKVLQGASFANVYLVKEMSNLFVRKYISKKKDLMIHVDILKRQCEDLKRLNFYKKDICPRILNEYESLSEYYYDMEYLKGYYKLSEFSSDIIYRVLPLILKDLHKYVYCYQKTILHKEGIQWLKDYYEEKLYPKYTSIPSLDPCLQVFFESNDIIINDKIYHSIPYYLEILYQKQLEHPNLCPEFICPIHGDLTLENILYDPETGNYKLIDPSGSRYMDAMEMDTAKLFQSLICDYVSWVDQTELVAIDNSQFQIDPIYFTDRFHRVQHMYSFNEYQRGIFYMSTYFIRMVPFMYAKSFQHALFVLILATHYLDSLTN